MSKEIRMIEINPGRMIPGGRMSGSFESKGHACTYCQGNGYLWQLDRFEDPSKMECQICKGSGKLDATITIEWKAGE